MPRLYYLCVRLLFKVKMLPRVWFNRFNTRWSVRSFKNIGYVYTAGVQKWPKSDFFHGSLNSNKPDFFQIRPRPFLYVVRNQIGRNREKTVTQFRNQKKSSSTKKRLPELQEQLRYGKGRALCTVVLIRLRYVQPELTLIIPLYTNQQSSDVTKQHPAPYDTRKESSGWENRRKGLYLSLHLHFTRWINLPLSFY